MSSGTDTAVRVATQARSTRANALALSGGRMVAALAQWLALIVLAKLSDLESVGVYALAQAICIPVSEIARLGLREVRASDVRDEFASGAYLAMRIGSAAIAFVVMVGIALVVADSAAALAVLVLYAVTRVIELLSDIFYAMLQREERLDLVGRSLGLLAVGSLAGLALGLLVSGSVVGATLGQVVAYAAVFVGFDLRVARRVVAEGADRSVLHPAWQRSALARLGRRVLPLGIATVLAMVGLHMTRLVVAGELGVEALGLYVPVMALAMAPGRVFQAMGTAATTRLSILHASGQRREFVALMGQLLTITAGLGLLGVLGCALTGDWILRTVYTDDYAGQGDVLVLVVLAAVARYSAEMLQHAMLAARRFWWLTWNHAASAAVAVVSSLVLIPRHGLEGAGEALVVVACFQLVVVTVGVMTNLPVRDERTGQCV